MQKGIISVDVLGLGKDYLTWPENVKQEVCIEKVTKAYEAMKIRATKEEKISIITDILNRSIKEYEKIEEFENCIILVDVKNALTTL